MKFYPVLFFFSLLLLLSCRDSSCENIVCLNGGVCEEGVCDCPDGFSGQFCTTNIDSCMNLCENGGICNKGNCDCPAGYIGQYCETLDPCFGVFCNNGAICNSGVCICQNGYEGNFCEFEWSAKFVSLFNSVNDDCGTAYASEIKALSPNQIELINLGNYTSNVPYSVKGVLTSALSLSITDTFGEVGGNADYYEISGMGLYDPSSKELQIDYTCTYSTVTDNCSVIYTLP